MNCNKCGDTICNICNECHTCKTKPSMLAFTQKAKGLMVLRSSSEFQYNVPNFNIYKASDLKTKQRRRLLVDLFARPCPVRPRHGFVDSRTIKTLRGATRLIHETLKEDPDAEIIAMKPINADLSAIWTPESYTIGPGNDGATSGKDCLVLPTLGELVSQGTQKLADIKTSPFVEIVYDKDMFWFVQLRDGAKVSASKDFIPKETKVTKVLEAKGDLLEWEKIIQNETEGTVIYHKDGSLASHYSIHAILKGLPVLTSRKPEIGEVLKPTTEETPKPDIKELQYGFFLGCTLDLTTKHAIDIMLVVCHHSPMWLGKFDRLIGFGLGCAWRLTVCAALGEYRHSPKSGNGFISRNQVYETAWNSVLSPDYIEKTFKALESFKCDRWSSGFGGKSWFNACINALDIYSFLEKKNALDAIGSLNKLVNAAHNGGWLFNKFANVQRMDQASACPARILIETGPLFYKIANLERHKIPWKFENIRKGVERLYDLDYYEPPPEPEESEEEEEDSEEEEPEYPEDHPISKPMIAPSDIIYAQAYPISVDPGKLHIQFKVKDKNGYGKTDIAAIAPIIDEVKDQSKDQSLLSQSLAITEKRYAKLRVENNQVLTLKGLFITDTQTLVKHYTFQWSE